MTIFTLYEPYAVVGDVLFEVPIKPEVFDFGGTIGVCVRLRRCAAPRGEDYGRQAIEPDSDDAEWCRCGEVIEISEEFARRWMARPSKESREVLANTWRKIEALERLEMDD